MIRPNNYQRFIIPSLIIIFAIWAMFVYARSSGVSGRTLLSSTPGCTCHGAEPNGQVSVVLEGPTQLTTSQTANYKVTISGGPLAEAGVNIAVSSGSLKPLDGSLQLSNNELIHTSPKAPGAGPVSFDFELTAPATEGTINLEATGNSVNSNQSTSGDAWNYAEGLSINVNLPNPLDDQESTVPFAFVLDQNYPNPFNPGTTIEYRLEKAGWISLQVYNMLGQRIVTLYDGPQEVGSHLVKFDGSALESGTYLYRLEVDGQSQTKRMLLVK